MKSGEWSEGEKSFYNWLVAEGRTSRYSKALIVYLRNESGSKGYNVSPFLPQYLSAFDCLNAEEIDDARQRALADNTGDCVHNWPSAALGNYYNYLLANFEGCSARVKILGYVEGARRIAERQSSEIERNPEARAKCLEEQGTACRICGFDSLKIYGVSGIIHVHHLNPLGESNGERSVDPGKDLIPVCPNCHAIIHSKKGDGCYTPEEVRLMIKDKVQRA